MKLHKNWGAWEKSEYTSLDLEKQSSTYFISLAKQLPPLFSSGPLCSYCMFPGTEGGEKNQRMIKENLPEKKYNSAKREETMILPGMVVSPGKKVLACLGFDNFVWIQLAFEPDSSPCQVPKLQDFKGSI